MPAYTQKELIERFQKLPAILQDALFSGDLTGKIFETGKKFGLTIEKIGFLAEEVGYVILGLTRPGEFAAKLADRLGVDLNSAKTIALDINHKVFSQLREALKSAHETEITAEEIQRAEPLVRVAPTAPPPAPAAPTSIPSAAPRPATPKEVVPPQPQPKPQPLQPAAKEEPVRIPQTPQPPQSKIPPIDLRREQRPAMQPPTATPQPESKPPAPVPEKKTPHSGFDPYREPIE
ncbi:MAG: hypothetical protein HYW89_02570 [Candidatus Sungiibacteriota bacterium]|uniref:Uncharacterized protein n=1 Tax=Candidatus Sungiibacteriota bacterium TaxID=2750080 RepID=A0A7T5RIS1_9BACT|nr:MAG: hypothetical protein HYW89_02570 [Candidatus Sungbacteria bacterium]